MRLVIASALLAASTQFATAATVPISVNPLTASGFDPDDGIRQVAFNQAIAVPSFDPAADSFLLNLAAFGLAGPLAFINALAADLPASGVNTVVLQDSDNDGNNATAFNAGTAANLIAGKLTENAAGFFVYFNSALSINRLVFSTNLNSTTSDLAILAAIQSPKGADAIAALPGFGAANFQAVAPVPLPAALPLMVAALAGLGLVRGRRRV
jgi:hypothetical protein